MRYIIMCGGQYDAIGTPKQLFEIKGETLVARTIRLLKENGVKDIAISTNSDNFYEFNVPILQHNNGYHCDRFEHIVEGLWIDAFYPESKPVCYIMGDVVFSHKAIKTIVETETKDIEFFASAPPFSYISGYVKSWAEPFAFKVQNNDHFFEAIDKTRELCKREAFRRYPIAWELWQVIKDTPINYIDYTNYTIINDYTCDIDHRGDIMSINELVDRNIIKLEE